MKKFLVATYYLILIPALSHAQQIASDTVAVNKIEDNAKTCIAGRPDTSANYQAAKWYRDSAERIAQYNEIYTLGLEKIQQKVKQQKLGKKNWGVILDIDETVLDNSEYAKEDVLTCNNASLKGFYAFAEQKLSIATPGASNFTCKIQKLGGKVVLITNRDGTFDNKIQKATIDNLKSAGICFNNVVFANGPKDNNKTPRFEAVTVGKYNNIIATGKLPQLKILGYFGDNIQDFPNITQSEAIKQDQNSDFYKKFGQDYFSLPNPTYGSWEKNQFN
jgi:5'-nucleotidase (lipoprotein e(P4) family)